MSKIYYIFCLNLLTFNFELALIIGVYVNKAEQLFDCVFKKARRRNGFTRGTHRFSPCFFIFAS